MNYGKYLNFDKASELSGQRKVRGPWSEAEHAAHAAGRAARQADLGHPYAVQRSWAEGSVQWRLVKLLESGQISPDLSALLWSMLGLIKAQDVAIGLLARREDVSRLL